MPWMNCRALLVLVLLAIAPPVYAQQDFPNRQLTMVVPFTPVATTDFLARLLSAKLDERLRMPVVVENWLFAVTNIGSSYVTKAARYAYTTLLRWLTPVAMHVIVL